MTSFYTSIAEEYDSIFPPNKAHLNYISKAILQKNRLNFLDIGCGTGNLSLGVQKLFKKINGIDLDEEMLVKAKEKNTHDNIIFEKMNMLDLENQFPINHFDCIACFGNTLVHLSSEEELLNCFKQIKCILKNGGKFLFQIINYDRILDQKIKGLPSIKNDQIEFIRNYHYTDSSTTIQFETVLTNKVTGKKIINSIPLLPIKQNVLLTLLKTAGYAHIKFYGSFKKDSLIADSIPLVGEAY